MSYSNFLLNSDKRDGKAKLFPHTMEEFLGVQRLFNEQGIPYYTYPLSYKNPMNAVINGIRKNTNLNGVSQKIAQIPRVHFNKYVDSTTRKQAGWTIILVQLTNTPKAAGLFNSKEILGMHFQIDGL